MRGIHPAAPRQNLFPAPDRDRPAGGRAASEPSKELFA
ncbi:hypothetical protein AvCA_18060 [Azotobacter vinelandii CA]|uniref:Uncharacterized protein n=2 Tax=Azotobacter vinelandii TaxID=354 RepID=C1DDP8_AZOVD|nr:hypothetical protein Avin_18060 [Azotobacter vinelandii DJ]AGK16893.1 hypothetical protein AvCA_18060 [Azotobacter vinelandii CA]AGK20175.1 hypothetical protein AvCA6_18060 [Azotobacter vinelandii CA6]